MDIIGFIKNKNLQGAIFDMDGTLTSSMSRWGEIYDCLFNKLGVKMPSGFIMRVNHLSMAQIVELVIKEFSLNAEPQAVFDYWLGCAVKFYENEFRIKPYMLEVLKELKRYGVKMCVATASDRRCAEAFIRSNNLTEYFSSVTGLSEVSRPKSFPDIYLKASQKLGVPPEKCIVFEDALTAVNSAKSGGFYVCGVQDDCSAKDGEEIKILSDITLGF